MVKFSANIANSPRRATPSPDFYATFSEVEILEIIDALKVRQEIPLKFSYKGRGAKIWDDFYRKYIIPTWYRTSNVEIELLQDNFQYLNDACKIADKVNIIDVGAGNSYPVKRFIHRLDKLRKVNQYVALDISAGLLDVSQKNFHKWFPRINYLNGIIDIENSCIPQNLLGYQSDDQTENNQITNIILHLGVTIGNHHHRARVFSNFKNSMQANDILVLTNELGSNSQWNGQARGGCDYHAGHIYRWIKDAIGISSSDCQLVRKYDSGRDSVVANIQFLYDYSIDFRIQGIDKSINFAAGDDITIWRHHKFEIPKLRQELEQAGLELVRYSTNKYSSHIMAICRLITQ
ncbi:L-histidine N(alpha)-methyltransferase [Calothrix sp. UHCC 0171]|uniref:L-histidine N(alpha)-methyltransferase n=1 Tax=Calothrix sp. UHCC 0171 TaxID=3110245 RepID=UPI002B213AF3|nr:L-histidine N(alpha)-methyltransferase [Calothrix sp. UHCC 0171]MEA5570889.1 L-histidine N(alpha)-methyltransferase [Calothrix sp. UHCC 0171]